MRLAYYPGCVLPTTGKEFDMSTREVFKALDVELVELEDWSCCGATAAYNIDNLLALALPARNLAIAEKSDLDMVTPCPTCSYWLSRTQEAVAEDNVSEKINRALRGTGLRYRGGSGAKHVLEVISRDIGVKKVKEKVVKPLTGLRVIPYYGCYIVRPPKKEPFDSPENPTAMDELIDAVGATLVPWDMKTKCCGGSLMVSKEDITLKLSYDLLKRAKSLDADCIVTPCQQCNLALDGKQRNIERAYNEKIGIPVLYFTQLLGLAFGISPKKLGLDKNIVGTEKLLESLGIAFN
jgi:heterodisulfide reductase subunit B